MEMTLKFINTGKFETKYVLKFFQSWIKEKCKVLSQKKELNVKWFYKMQRLSWQLSEGGAKEKMMKGQMLSIRI